MGLELGMREWMLLAGIALVVVILLDAIRRALKQRAENERLMRAKKTARQEPHADFDWLKELPNGGARVVYRADETADSTTQRQAIDSDELAPDAAHAEAAEAKEDPSQTVEHRESLSAAVEDHSERALDPVMDDAVESGSTGTEATVAATRTTSASAGQTVDWLETLDTEEEPAEEAPTLIEDTPPEHVLLIHLKADEHKPYQGDTLLQLLLACDLRFGDLGFFHRHEQSGGRGPIQFSVANLLKPGVFDIDSMSTLQTAGVVFFMRVPGPKDLLTAYEAMLETARAVVQHLGGTLLDHSHSVLTKQAIEHDKTLLREYARKQLLQKRS